MTFDDVLRYVLNEANVLQNAIREIFVVFDTAVYYLLQFMYELFFNIATMTLLDGEMIYKVFSRVQLILGIYMMFQLVMIIIKGIVNPDSFTDAKNGAGHVIMRIIVSLVLLALIVPINIKSPKNEYEKQINNNGILFGTLYSLQYRILANNTIGKLILGDDSTYYASDNSKVLDIRRYANRFTNTIVKTFYQLNVDSNGEYICHDGFDKIYNGTGTIALDDLDPAVIIVNGRLRCGSERFLLEGVNFNTVAATNQYRLTMNWLSTIIGIVLVVVFFMLTFNVATRVFKLAALQLIAPIPIISYMDPKGSKDSAFNAWVKMLTTTYLELFIQLAVIYFSFSIINKFIEKFFSVGNAASTAWNAFAGGASMQLLNWTFIIMTIALFIFAKDAPKFFKQMLGIKDEGKGFFGAFGNAMGLGVAAVGTIGSFRASRDASVASVRERAKQYAKDRNWDAETTENYIASQVARNRGRHNAAGVLGAGAGFVTGANAAFNAKGGGMAKGMAAVNSMNVRNSKALAAGRAGGGLIGALGSGAEQLISGESPYDRMLAQWQSQENELKNRELKLKETKDQKAHLEANLNRHKSKSEDCTWTSGSYTIDGLTVTANYRDFDSYVQAGLDHGANVVKLYEFRDTENGVARVTRFTQSEYDQLAADFQKECVDVSYLDYRGQHIPMASLKDYRIGLKDANDKDRAQKTTECALRVMDYMFHDNLSKDEAIVRAKEDMKTDEYIATGLDAATARANAHAYVTSDEHKGEDVFDDSIYNHMLGFRNSRIAEIIANSDPENRLTSDAILNADYEYRHRANLNDGQQPTYVIDMPDSLGSLKKAIGDTGARIDSENDEINRLHVKVNEAKRRVEATAAEKNRDYLFKNK